MDGRSGRPEQLVRHGVTDEGAGTGATDEVSFVQQLFVRVQHRQPRDAQIRGECPRRGNPLAWSKPAVEDRPSESFANLSMNRLIDLPVDGEVERWHWPNSVKVVMSISTNW